MLRFFTYIILPVLVVVFFMFMAEAFKREERARWARYMELCQTVHSYNECRLRYVENH